MTGSWAKPWDSLTKLSQITRPSDRYAVVEEDDDGRNFNMGSWMPDIRIKPQPYIHGGDPLTIRHGRSGKSCFAFVDGHAEQRKWSNEVSGYFRALKKRGEIVGFRTYRPASEDGKDDIRWLYKGWARKK